MGPPGKIYVSMYGDDNVTVIDQATHAIVSKIPVGKGPAVLLATPDNKKLYTANWSDNSISAIDIAAGTSKPIVLDGRPWAIAMSPVGTTLFAGVASNKVDVIDTTTDTIATSFDTSPDFPESVIVSADGSQVYIDPSSTSLSALSAGTLESISATDGGVVEPPITVGETPAFASISTDGTRAYTLNFLPGTVSVVDTTTWQLLTTIDAGSGSQPIISTSTPDGTLVVTNFGTGNLLTVDFKTNAILHTLTLDGRPVGVGGFNADGTLGYICDFGHASLAVQETIPLSLSFLQGDLSPFVGNGPGHVSAFNPSTGEKIGTSITVGKGPTSVVVIAP
jgi:YVTN family beta-propeller protein